MLDSVRRLIADCVHGMAQTSEQDGSYRVHTLYKPPDGIDHTATIIFFQGLSRGPNEWEDTWMTRGPRESQVCWPKAWLPKHFDGKVVVLAPAYDSGPRGVNEDVSEIGHNLRVSLVCSDDWKLADPNKPQSIILVGHGFGGLVIKSLVCAAQKIANQRCHNAMERRATAYCKAFINNLKGVVFYSVPHSGTKEDYLTYWTKFSHSSHIPKKGRLAGIMKNLEKQSRRMQELTEDFKNYVPADMAIRAFNEGKFIPGTEKLLVPDASAMQTARREFFKVEGADHFEVCRPLKEADKAHKLLIEFLDGTAGPLTKNSTSTNSTQLELLL